jgi:hypothetical protein
MFTPILLQANLSEKSSLRKFDLRWLSHFLGCRNEGTSSINCGSTNDCKRQRKHTVEWLSPQPSSTRRRGLRPTLGQCWRYRDFTGNAQLTKSPVASIVYFPRRRPCCCSSGSARVSCGRQLSRDAKEKPPMDQSAKFPICYVVKFPVLRPCLAARGGSDLVTPQRAE